MPALKTCSKKRGRRRSLTVVGTGHLSSYMSCEDARKKRCKETILSLDYSGCVLTLASPIMYLNKSFLVML